MSFSDDVADSKCSICLSRFYDPIILNCGHTFDRLCVQKLIDSNSLSDNPLRSIRCPLCNHIFDPREPLISNKSLTNIIKSEPTFECFLIDISLNQEKTNVLTFLKHVFNKRDIFENNHIILETNDVKLSFNSNTNFDQELKLTSLNNLEHILQETYHFLQDKNGVRKICILTDGLTKHSNVTKINSDIIHKRLIIHVGDKNARNTRELADRINFQFGYFNKKILEIYVQDFITNF